MVRKREYFVNITSSLISKEEDVFKWQSRLQRSKLDFKFTFFFTESDFKLSDEEISELEEISEEEEEMGIKS